MSVEGFQGSTAPYKKVLHTIRPFQGAIKVAERMRGFLKDSQNVLSHQGCGRVQDPYSIRCIPQVHGASRNAYQHLNELTEIELNSVTVGIGSVFSYPIFVIFIEYARGTKLQSYQILLIFSGFLGLYLLLDLGDVKSITGIIYGLISAVSLAFIITIGERYSSKLGGLKVAFSQLIVAAFILIKFTFDSWDWMISNILISLFLGLFLTALGLTTYWYVVKVIKPLAVSTITYLEPVTGVVLGALILNENLEIIQVIGFSIVISVGVLQVYLDSKVSPSSSS